MLSWLDFHSHLYGHLQTQHDPDWNVGPLCLFHLLGWGLFPSTGISQMPPVCRRHSRHRGYGGEQHTSRLCPAGAWRSPLSFILGLVSPSVCVGAAGRIKELEVCLSPSVEEAANKLPILQRQGYASDLDSLITDLTRMPWASVHGTFRLKHSLGSLSSRHYLAS